MIKGKLIVFEGPDGVGKTRLSKFAANFLHEKDKSSYWMSFPGREEGTLGNLVYKVHHAPLDFDIRTITPAAKQALHIAAHLDAIESKILPLLSSGVNVILDRFWWSTWVYGINSGLDQNTLDKLIKLEQAVWSHNMPSLLFLVKANVPRERDEDFKFWQGLKSTYNDLAALEERLYPIKHIDNNGPIAETTKEVEDSLLKLM